MPLKIKAGPNRPVAAFLTNTEDEGNDLRWNAIPDAVRSPGQIPKASQAALLVALFPNIEERSGDAEEAARLTHVSAHALRMLQHAQPALHLPILYLLVDRILHPEPPAVGCENTPPVRDVY